MFRGFSLFAVLMMPLLSACSTSSINEDQANVRAVHASHDTFPMDIKIGQNVTFFDLAFSETSAYLGLPVGSQKAQIYRAGSPSTPFLQTDLVLEKETSYTLFLFKTGSNLEASFHKDPPVLDVGKAVIRLFHAIPDLPSLDFKASKPSETTLFANLQQKALAEYKTFDEADYNFVLTATGQTSALAEFPPMKIEKGKVYTFLLQGTLSSADRIPVSLHILIDGGDGTGGKSAVFFPR